MLTIKGVSLLRAIQADNAPPELDTFSCTKAMFQSITALLLFTASIQADFLIKTDEINSTTNGSQFFPVVEGKDYNVPM